MSFRVVTSCYKDNEILDTWIPILEQNKIAFTIYYKVESLQKGEEEVLNESSINIPNYGRCEYAFLYHIIKNYENLDDVTMFVKNNWKYEGINVWNHIEQCRNVDFMESGKWRRFQYWKNEYSPFPVHEEIYKSEHPYAETIMDWYNEVFPGIPVPHVIPGWGAGPCFSVSRKLIQRHPKEVYQRLLEKFYPESGSWNIEKASKIFPDMKAQMEDIGKCYHDRFQRFWYVLFTHNIDPHKYIISNHSWNPYD